MSEPASGWKMGISRSVQILLVFCELLFGGVVVRFSSLFVYVRLYGVMAKMMII